MAKNGESLTTYLINGNQLMNNFCIIGAGVAGIELAKKLKGSVVVEKSGGIGGRIASRRLGSHSVNHGPQEFHHTFINETISNPHSWIKLESDGLVIHKKWEVSHFEFLDDAIRVIGLQGQTIDARKIIITAPAPQARAMMIKSGLMPEFLEQVKYKSAIQFMVLLDQSADVSKLDEYLTVVKTTHIPDGQSLHLYEMKQTLLADFLELDKEEIKKFLLQQIECEVLDSHVHKWRYSEVTSSIAPEFQTAFKNKNLFLAGDYFGNNGVDSSLLSVKNLLPYF